MFYTKSTIISRLVGLKKIYIFAEDALSGFNHLDICVIEGHMGSYQIMHHLAPLNEVH